MQCRALEFAVNEFSLYFSSTLESYRARLKSSEAIEKLEENAFFEKEEMSQHRATFDILKADDHTPLQALLIKSKLITDLEAVCTSLDLKLSRTRSKRDEYFEANCDSEMQLHSFVLGIRQNLM